MRIHLAAALIEFGVGRAQVAAGGFNLTAAGFEVFGHAVEGADQVSDFIGGADVDAIVETAAGNFLRGFGEGREWTRHDFREEQREPRGYE